MTVLNRNDAVANMKKKGFVEGRKGKHIPYNFVTSEGKRTSITTHISHTPKQKVLSDNLISAMAKQCYLSKADFIRFAKCAMTQQEYELRLKQDGKI